MSQKPKTPKRSDEETEALERALLPVSPATGLDPEIRQFLSRMMTGYEAAHRCIADMAATQSQSTAELHRAVTGAIQIQMRAAEERENLISQRHTRELETEAAKQRQQTNSELKRDFRTVLLLTAKKFAGIPITGNDSHGLQDFLATMTPEQFDGLMSTGTLQLSDAQRISIASVIASLGEAEAKKLGSENPTVPVSEAAE